MAVEKETQLEVWLEENMPEPGGGIIAETLEVNAAVGDDATDFKNFMDNAINSLANVGFCAISVEQPGSKIFFRCRALTTASKSHMDYQFGQYDKFSIITVSYYIDSTTFRSVFGSPVVLTWYHTPIQ